MRQPREAVGDADLLELPAGKLDEEGESPLECGAARARRGDRQGGRALGAPRRATTPRPGFTDEEVHVYLATGLSDAPGQAIEGERITVEPRPLAELDALIAECRDAKTLIGLLLLQTPRRA